MNGYRYYEEPQLLRLQQILLYRELGFELKQIEKVLDRPEFENVRALQAHREVLEENISRIWALLDTIDNTLRHLKGNTEMRSEEMFNGFSVPAGKVVSTRRFNLVVNRMTARYRHGHAWRLVYFRVHRYELRPAAFAS